MDYAIRKLKPEELSQAVKLADNTFRDKDHASMGDAYPHIFNPGIIHSFGAFDGDKLVGFIGLVPNIIHIGKAEVTIFSIGSVATDLAYRKQGISSAILTRVYDYIDEAGASLLIVSGDRGLYRRNECHYFGQMESYAIKQGKFDVTSNTSKIRQFKETDMFEILRLRKEKDVRFEGSLLELSTLFKAEAYVGNLKMDQEIVVAESNDKIVTYVIVGIPNENSQTDKGIVTEWAGDEELIPQLLDQLLTEYDLPEIEFKVLWHEDIKNELTNYESKEVERDNTLYLVDSTRLLDQMRPYLFDKNPDLAERLEIIKVADQTYQLTLGDIQKELDIEELITILFSFDSDLQTGELASLFPIPLPFMDGTFFV